MRIDSLDASTILDIGRAFACYDYGAETGLDALFSGREAVAAYICGYARAMLRAGFLRTTSSRCEGFIAYRLPGERVRCSAVWPLLQGTLQAARPRELVRFWQCMHAAGPGLREQFAREKKPCIYVGMVCVREAYQGQGFMRTLMDMAFADGDRLGVPVILDTDAMSKCEKYQHLGMELAGTRPLGDRGRLYDLIRYPAAPAAASEP